MILEAAWIGIAFALGLGARSLGLPSLVGYLAAGFAISALSQFVSLPEYSKDVLAHVAHLGVLLLLFTIGLKLSLKSMIQAPIIGAGLLHFGITVLLFTPAIHYSFELAWGTALLIAIALSFSSTVLSAKTLESKKELRAFHGRIAIGILVLQDIVALVTISLSTGKVPTPWALLVFLLPLLRPLLYRLLDRSGDEDLFTLFGLLAALVIGGYSFELVGLSSELGALLLGFLISGHKKSMALSRSLWSIKEFFLVGFFLQIGMGGLPSSQDWIFASTMLIVLPLKGFLFFLLLTLFRLRARSAFLAGLSLTAYSEFGLILSSLVLPEWITPLGLTVALSFVISAPFNSQAHTLYERLCRFHEFFERGRLHEAERTISLANTEVLVMGLGRAGTAAYQSLEKDYNVMGMDSDPLKVEKHQKAGRKVFYADAEDHTFWSKLDIGNIQGVILAMNDSDAKLGSIQRLRHRGFKGSILSNCLSADDLDSFKEAGADVVHLPMTEAGVSLAKAFSDRKGS